MHERDSARRSLTGISASLAFFHKANIERYRKLLTTDLTSDERKIAERRLADEEAALSSLHEG